MFVYPDPSKIKYIIYRQDFHNLQIRKNGTNNGNRTLHK